MGYPRLIRSRETHELIKMDERASRHAPPMRDPDTYAPMAVPRYSYRKISAIRDLPPPNASPKGASRPGSMFIPMHVVFSQAPPRECLGLINRRAGSCLHEWPKRPTGTNVKCIFGNPSSNFGLYCNGSDWLNLTAMHIRDGLAMVIGARFEVSDVAARPRWSSSGQNTTPRSRVRNMWRARTSFLFPTGTIAACLSQGGVF